MRILKRVIHHKLKSLVTRTPAKKIDTYIHVYEPLENFSKVYEEDNPNESLFSTQESDVTVNKVTKICEASPSSNHSTTDTVNVIDENHCSHGLHHEDEAPASSNNTVHVYEEVTPQETLNSGMDDQEMGKKMESKTTSTIEQALACNSEGGKTGLHF